MVNLEKMKDGLKIVVPWGIASIVVLRLFAYTSETARQAEANAEALRKIEKIANQVSADHDKLKDLEGTSRVHENRLNQQEFRINQIESKMRQVAEGGELITGEVVSGGLAKP